jgi:hypothetical protein
MICEGSPLAKGDRPDLIVTSPTFTSNALLALHSASDAPETGAGTPPCQGGQHKPRVGTAMPVAMEDGTRSDARGQMQS